MFDDGRFSENETFLITDWFKHTPRDVLAKNFGVPESAFADLPVDIEHERYIFPALIPGPLETDAVPSPAGLVPQTFSHRLMEQKPIEGPGGRARVVDSRSFHAATTIAAALVEVDPGGIRELHWHPNADEWQYYVENTGDEPLVFLEMFRRDRFADVSLNQWMALTPSELVRAHLNLHPETIAALAKRKPVVPSRPPRREPR